MPDAIRHLETPLGCYALGAVPDGLVLVKPVHAARRTPERRGDRRSEAHLDATQAALREYFAGARRDFADLRLALLGSDFLRRCWQALCAIPFGETVSYGQQARSVGFPHAARAVGLANARNPIALIVPCHRVIGANGKLTGYAGGIWRKQWLLDHERGAARE
jgi:O-6-methylguanine DNA methyltransferase